jgi:hypothetical protein
MIYPIQIRQKTVVIYVKPKTRNAATRRKIPKFLNILLLLALALVLASAILVLLTVNVFVFLGDLKQVSACEMGLVLNGVGVLLINSFIGTLLPVVAIVVLVLLLDFLVSIRDVYFGLRLL